MGYEPLQVVPSVLLSEFLTGLLAGFTHHTIGNVNFKPRTMNIKKMYFSLKRDRSFKQLKNRIPEEPQDRHNHSIMQRYRYRCRRFSVDKFA